MSQFVDEQGDRLGEAPDALARAKAAIVQPAPDELTSEPAAGRWSLLARLALLGSLSILGWVFTALVIRVLAR